MCFGLLLLSQELPWSSRVTSIASTIIFITLSPEKIKFTGNKFQNKKYYRHTGYPGGIKEITPEKLSEKKPGEVLKLAVKRMLPSGALGKKQLTKLKIYSGEEHPHTAQNPKIIEIGKLNQKNVVRN